MVMKNYRTRQEFYSGLGGFKCCCELCQEEAINCDDEIYEVFQRLENEVEKRVTLNGTRKCTEIVVVRTNDSSLWLIRGSAMS